MDLRGFWGVKVRVVLEKGQRLRTSDRRDLDKGLSLSPGAMLYARRRPLLDFESLIFKTAMDLRLAGEYFGEETMLGEPRGEIGKNSMLDRQAVARSRNKQERDLGRVALISDTPVKHLSRVHNMASRLPKPVTMTTRATRSKATTPTDPGPMAARTTRTAAMKPREPPAPVKKTATRKVAKAATKDSEEPSDSNAATTKKAPAATSKQTNGAHPVVIPPDHDIEPIKVSVLRIRSRPAFEHLVSRHSFVFAPT